MLERKGGGRKGGEMLGFPNIFCHFLKIVYVSICFEQREFKSNDISNSYISERKNGPLATWNLEVCFRRRIYILSSFPFPFSLPLPFLSLSSPGGKFMATFGFFFLLFSRGKKEKRKRTGQKRSKKTVREPNQLVRNFSNSSEKIINTLHSQNIYLHEHNAKNAKN